MHDTLFMLRNSSIPVDSTAGTAATHTMSRIHLQMRLKVEQHAWYHHWMGTLVEDLAMLTAQAAPALAVPKEAWDAQLLLE